MGLGDDLMITAFAEQEKKKHKNKQIVIGSLEEKKFYNSLIYLNNPNITPIDKVNKNKPIHFIDYHSRNRPYIDYKNSNKSNRKWNMKFSPVPGRLYFTEDEKRLTLKILETAQTLANT